MPSIFDVLGSRKSDDAELHRPDVIVDFIFEEGLFFIAVQNIGTRPAFDISVKFNKSITGAAAPKKKKISDINLFKKISFLPPGKEIRTFVDTSAAYFARKEPTRIITRITFKDENSRAMRNSIKHNLEIYRDIGYIIER